MSEQRGPIGVVCDFDGAITDRDVAGLLLTAFVPGQWEPWDEEYAAGRIGVKECLKRQFALLRASIEEVTAYALAPAWFRPGFREFVDFCRERDIVLVVASAGLAFSIRAILQAVGVAVPEPGLRAGRVHP